MRKFYCLIVLAAIVVAGCATAPKPRSIVNAFDQAASFDQVWSATVETFADMSFPIDNMEKDSGLITTDWINITGTSNEEYCDCGGLGLAIENARRVKFNVFVKEANSKVVVKVNCQFQQTRSLGNNVGNTNCVSTGKLEARINELIREKTGN